MLNTGNHIIRPLLSTAVRVVEDVAAYRSRRHVFSTFNICDFVLCRSSGASRYIFRILIVTAVGVELAIAKSCQPIVDTHSPLGRDSVPGMLCPRPLCWSVAPLVRHARDT